MFINSTHIYMFINSTHISNVCNSFHYLNPGTKSAVILNADSVKVLRSTSKYIFFILTLQKIREESLKRNTFLPCFILHCSIV